MTLINLKKRAPLAETAACLNRPAIAVDQFIEDANRYASGKPSVIELFGNEKLAKKANRTLRNATFSLGDSAIEQLDDLANRTGISKSRLIRIWLQHETDHPDPAMYQNSEAK